MAASQSIFFARAFIGVASCRRQARQERGLHGSTSLFAGDGNASSILNHRIKRKKDRKTQRSIRKGRRQGIWVPENSFGSLSAKVARDEDPSPCLALALLPLFEAPSSGFPHSTPQRYWPKIQSGYWQLDRDQRDHGGRCLGQRTHRNLHRLPFAGPSRRAGLPPTWRWLLAGNSTFVSAALPTSLLGSGPVPRR